MNQDEVNALATVTTAAIKATPVYDDAIQPVAKELGKALKTLGGVINVALTPLALLVYGYEKIQEQLRERLEQRLSKIKPENIVTPRLQVVGPLLERYKYIHDNEDLSEMFINLLANAMDKDSIQKAHPSFVNIISELSPDEAKLIKTISQETVLPKLDIRVQSKASMESGYSYVYINFTLLGEKAELVYPDLTPSYLSNLERLRIITCNFGSREAYANKDHYKDLDVDQKLADIKKQYESTHRVDVIRGIIRVTDFGNMFMNAVLQQ